MMDIPASPGAPYGREKAEREREREPGAGAGGERVGREESEGGAGRWGRRSMPG